MTYGFYQRTLPRISVKRGFQGNEPQSITMSLPAKAGENILSGMLIVPAVNGTTGTLEWVKSASNVDTKNTVPYFAFSDDTDTDVVSSNRLLGLSCLGEFELTTGYFDNTQTYNVGDALIKSTTAGSITNQAASFLSAIEVVAIVSKGGKQDVMKPLNASGRQAPPINSEATPVNGSVFILNLITRWKPAQS
jgi:hypothetical protein